MSEAFELETPRLFLRKVTMDSYDDIFRESVAEQMKFFGARTDKDLEVWVNRYEGGMTTFNKKFLIFHLIDKEAMINIGWCGYHTWYTDHDRAELGYVMENKAYRQRGLMGEALELIIRYGFEKMNLNRIEAFTFYENIASTKLLLRFGFQKEGVMREHYVANGIAEDSVIYSLLKSEFK